MRWNSAHVGNIRQAPLGDQEVVNPEIKVPDEQNPLVEDEELEPAPTRRGTEDPNERAPKDPPPHGSTPHAPEPKDAKDAPKASDKPAASGSPR